MSRYETFSSEGVPPKPDWTSKTLWTNVVIGVIGGLHAVMEKGLLSQESIGIVVVAGAILTIVFRYMTNSPIEFTGMRLFASKKNDNRPGSM